VLIRLQDDFERQKQALVNVRPDLVLGRSSRRLLISGLTGNGKVSSQRLEVCRPKRLDGRFTREIYGWTSPIRRFHAKEEGVGRG
jgi:hypothetical protein